MTQEMDEKVMESWDGWRKYIAEGGTASWPRDEFENLIDWYEGRIKELEAELTKIKADPSIGKLIVEEWSESPDY